MDIPALSKLTEILVNILLVSFSLVCFGIFGCLVQSMVYDRRNEKREKRKEKRDLENRRAQMKETR